MYGIKASDVTSPRAKRSKSNKFDVQASGVVHQNTKGAAMSKQPVQKKKRVNRKKVKSLSLVTPPDLSQYAVCWVKVKGYTDWPGVIERITNDGKYEIHFFGDYTTSIVTKSKITNFFEGFSLFSSTFDAPKLNKAITEAGICMMKNPKPETCYICEILKMKANLFAK